MKREIKFRAWDEQNKVMHLDFEFIRSGNEGNDWILFVSDKQTLKAPWQDNPYFRQQFHIMQFTGLKDKNGKEIYEGDVLHIEYFKMAVGENLGVYEAETEMTGVVEFDGLSLILQNIVGEKWQDYTGYDAGEGRCKFMYLGDVYAGSLDASYQIEVIGNIYENPELINNPQTE